VENWKLMHQRPSRRRGYNYVQTYWRQYDTLNNGCSVNYNGLNITKTGCQHKSTNPLQVHLNQRFVYSSFKASLLNLLLMKHSWNLWHPLRSKPTEKFSFRWQGFRIIQTANRYVPEAVFGSLLWVSRSKSAIEERFREIGSYGKGQR
jgi:hypothetical protein